jgi:SAM-dependent methyltransferase
MEAPERFDPQAMHGRLIEAEHLARYWWAAALVPGKRVLDAGCGTAYGSEILARSGASEVVGVDLDQAVVEAARASTGTVSLEVADVRHLPYPDASFDAAVCFEVIEHVDDPETILDELRRVLRPDGLLIVSSPNRDVYPPGNPHHRHEFTPDELAEALSARFEQVRLVRQHDWLGSGVVEDADFAAGGEGSFSAVVRKAVRGAPGEELYTLALASAAELPQAEPLVLLTETADAKWWQEQLEQIRGERDTIERTLAEQVARLAERDAQLRKAEAEKVELHEVIRSMQATRVWKLGTSYWNLRDRLLRRLG